MNLAVIFDNKIYDLDVPVDMIVDAQDLYTKMDKDMDKGWQVSSKWVSNPNLEQRCQIVADKIFDAFNNENEKMVLLMAGYILSHLPDVKEVTIDTSGEISETTFRM